MKVAELFVNLGIKGTEEASKGVGKVDKGMKGLVSRGIAVKAAFIAAGVAFTRIIKSSANAGTSLKNFESVTGLSVDTLQKWQKAGKAVGIEASQITQSFKGLQSSLQAMKLTNISADLAVINDELIRMGSSPIQLEDFNDAFYVAQKLSEFSKNSDFDKGRKRQLLSSLVDDEFIALLNTDAINPKNLEKYDTLSKKQIENLSKLNAKVGSISSKFQKATQKIAGDISGGLIEKIDLIVNGITKLVLKLNILSEKVGVFKALSFSLEVIFNGIAASLRIIEKSADGWIKLINLIDSSPKSEKTKKLGETGKTIYKETGLVFSRRDGYTPPRARKGNFSLNVNSPTTNNFNGTSIDSDLRKSVNEGTKKLRETGKTIYEETEEHF